MKLNNETKIGILVVAVAFILGVLTWKAGNFDFTPEGYVLKVRFQNIDGLKKNAPVTLNGLEVGRVKDVEILYNENNWVELSLWMDAQAKVGRGATAMIKNMGFLGEKYVGITSPPTAEAYYQTGDVIVGAEPQSFEKILADGEVIAANIKEISEKVNERLRVNSEAIDAVIADMRLTMDNVKAISANVRTRLEVNDEHIDAMMAHLNAASANLEEMSYDLKENPWKLLYKPQTKKRKGSR